MGELLTNCSEVELQEFTIENRLPFYNLKTIPFSQLKKGDAFRMKVHGESTNYCYDMFGREYFRCAGDAYYDEFKGWSVELHE
jgi:hypothetical protein